uniref:Uncharacterized protein n=1 Tax=Siphoviridae sp. ctgBD49 TaxID=2826420 RepID=A0A8S5QQ31_9CAUD|nr:MAG TPA: hypothetical protein [Siphoviridae sp. ctgBD49]
MANNIIGTVGIGAASVQPDWNQNDPKAKDYIKNRPGGYVDDVKLIFNEGADGKYAMDTTAIKYVSIDESFLEEGAAIAVTVNGENHKLTCRNYDNTYDEKTAAYGEYDSSGRIMRAMRITFLRGYGIYSGKYAIKKCIYADRSMPSVPLVIASDLFAPEAIKIPKEMLDVKTGNDLVEEISQTDAFKNAIFDYSESGIIQPIIHMADPNYVGVGDTVEMKINGSYSSTAPTLERTIKKNAAGDTSTEFSEFVLNNDESVILRSSTSGSTKKFKITVDDSGAISATEVT